MTNPNARDLIRRLADELDAWVMAHSLGGKPPETQYSIELVLQAHAYLAQPEPAAGPTDEGLLLDPAGLRQIRAWTDDHPGGLVIVDSLAASLPAGVDPDRAGVRRPIQGLAEAISTGWGLLLHHTRKGAGKDRNLGVGAQIDAAVSSLWIRSRALGSVMAVSVVVFAVIGACWASLHLVIASDETGNWQNHGSADALKQQEKEERVRANLTETQEEVLMALEATNGWMTVRDLAQEQGEQYDPKGSAAARLRKVLSRLESLGLIERKRVGVECTYRAKQGGSHTRGDVMSGSHGKPPTPKP